jgi:hypothetical protein
MFKFQLSSPRGSRCWNSVVIYGRPLHSKNQWGSGTWQTSQWLITFAVQRSRVLTSLLGYGQRVIYCKRKTRMKYIVNKTGDSSHFLYLINLKNNIILPTGCNLCTINPHNVNKCLHTAGVDMNTRMSSFMTHKTEDGCTVEILRKSCVNFILSTRKC